jgi:hypothetical protein
MAAHSTPTLQNHFAAHVGAKWHAQKFDQNAKIVCRGTRVGKYGEFGAWRRTKFDGELNIKEKIKRIMGWRGIGSRIQEIHSLIVYNHSRKILDCCSAFKNICLPYFIFNS